MENSLGSIIVQLKADATQLQAGIAAAQRSINGFSEATQRSLNFKDFASQAANSFNQVASGVMLMAKTMLVAAVPFGALIGFGVKSAAELQTAQQSMTALTGSTQIANQVLGKLYQFVLGKPLTFPDAAQAAKTLLGYGVAADQAITLTEAIGKASIVTGGNFQQIALAMGQVNSRGKLMGQDALQLINNSIPVTTILAKGLGISIQQAADDMNGGKISAQQFNDALVNWSNTLDINKFGSTLENRLITLKGSLRSMAFAILGIKIDPIHGFVIEAGGLFDRFSNAIANAAKTVKSWTPTITKAFDFIVANAKTLEAAIGALAIVFVVAKVAAIGFSIATFAASGPVGLIIVGITALIGVIAFLQLRFGLVTQAIQFLQPALSFIGQTFSQLWQQISILVQALAVQLAPAINFVREHATFFKDVLLVLIGLALIPVLAPIAALIAIIKVLTEVLAFVNSHLDAVKIYISALFFPIVLAITHLGMLERAFLSLANGAANSISGILSFVGSIPSRILGAVGNLGGILYNAGRDIIQGFLNGMGSLIGAIGQFFLDKLPGWIREPFKKALGIKSPSTEFMGYGKNIVQGLVQGINDSAHLAATAMNSLTAVGPTLNASLASGQQLASVSNSNSTKIYGNINIGNKQDADYFFKRLDQNAQLESWGITPQ